MSLKATEISSKTFNDLLSSYPNHVPSKLHDLEAFRNTELPTTLNSRTGKDLYLRKPELTRLPLTIGSKHGTFRPTLLSLVSSNDDSAIESATASAYAAHTASPDAYKHSNAVTSLRGVGIATGSLVLSVLDPEGVPFFGDEVFRWVMWDEPHTGPSSQSGWARKIGYTAKEYKRFAEMVKDVVERLGVGAGDVERVGYVLGKEKRDLAGDGGDVERETEEGEKETVKKGVKRKVGEEKASQSEVPKNKKKTKVESGKSQAVETTRSTRSSSRRKT
ncbi:hypothetical protein BT63DRAFT_483712 [Microthyrium microscopicum]|uniref:Uncharacterized protein n=1 Tax=Microthyrium microscopicum TaxID=703497 RepID=A0A6A6U026_9PEZI|nr:hypothetical protein BT63DRAFT_483712 [Microthyrium microscopicum]